jgi:hypothetical protein
VTVPFVQSFDENGYIFLQYYHADSQKDVHPTKSGGATAITTAPDGNIVQVWMDLNNQLYYAGFDRSGNGVITTTQLTDHSTMTVTASDIGPTVAVAPNGNIAIAWYRRLWNPSNTTRNFNIYYAILDKAGGTVVPETNITNNAQWGAPADQNVPLYMDPNIVSTADNRFVIAWHRYRGSDPTDVSAVWYTVRGSAGASIKSPTQFSPHGSMCDEHPNLSPLSGGSILLTYRSCSQIVVGRLDSAGGIVAGPTPLPSASGYNPDAVQLPGGNIVVAWTFVNAAKYNIQYSVLNPSLGTVKAATHLSSVSPVGDDLVSVTYSGNKAVLTWNDVCCASRKNLYYALLDDTGGVLTPPTMIVAANDMDVAANGQGNTYLFPDPKAYLPVLRH